MSLATDEPSTSASAAMARVHTCIARPRPVSRQRGGGHDARWQPGRHGSSRAEGSALTTSLRDVSVRYVKQEGGREGQGRREARGWRSDGFTTKREVSALKSLLRFLRPLSRRSTCLNCQRERARQLPSLFPSLFCLSFHIRDLSQDHETNVTIEPHCKMVPPQQQTQARWEELRVCIHRLKRGTIMG